MAYQLLPNLILLLSIIGILILVLRRLPEASTLDQQEAEIRAQPQARLQAKGLPARAASRTKAFLQTIIQRIWHFMLEAKGLRQGAAVDYKLKKIWPRKAPPPKYDEAHYLYQIKQSPKDLEAYNRLGQFYLERKSYEEAKHVYDYLTKHNPANSDYLAKLGYTYLYLQDYKAAVDYYERSLRLDSGHPSRYYNLALAYSARGRSVRAADALKKALALEPENVKYKKMLDHAVVAQSVEQLHGKE